MSSIRINAARRMVRLPLTLCLLASAAAVHAETLNPPPAPAIGSTNVAIADLNVARPASSPCIVTLLNNQEFANYSEKPFTFTPPAACPAPWSKVVFEADMSVTEGVQYDRTTYIYMGGVNIFFGTTSEPSETVGPSWHVERDLTDYTALFTTAQSGAVSLGNTYNSTYNGDIFGTFTLEFYPVDSTDPAPATASSVLPLAADSVGLSSGTSLLSQTFTLPTNIDSAYLDVMAQGQSGDEFWYTCVPDGVATELESCSGTAFREVEITIDGTSAGVAPIYPWIFTGGIDPFLWAPTPGVQTLDFVPYRVNLTPFAGLLSNGQPHTVALSVYNADNYFSVSGNLLLFLDSSLAQVTGSVITNTLTPPTPEYTSNVFTGANGGIQANVETTSNRSFVIAGTATTSAGVITTTITQTVGFSNTQKFSVLPIKYLQAIEQNTTLTSTTSIANATTGITAVNKADYTYPLLLSIDETVNKENIAVSTAIQQLYSVDTNTDSGTGVVFHNHIYDTVSPSDTIHYSTAGDFLGHTGNQGTQHYIYRDSTGGCYDRTIASLHGAVSAVTDHCESTAAPTATKK